MEVIKKKPAKINFQISK